jgi:ribosomal protein S18 acetylase RimI-like enzyme
MDAAERWARGRGYALMQLNVVVQNEAARGLYERLGYRPEWLKYIKELP